MIPFQGLHRNTETKSWENFALQSPLQIVSQTTYLNIGDFKTNRETRSSHIPSPILGAYPHFKATFPLTDVVASCPLLLYVISLKVCNFQVTASENLVIIANYSHITESFANFVMYYPLEPLPTTFGHHSICLVCSVKQKALQQYTACGILGYLSTDEQLKVIAGVGTEIQAALVLLPTSHLQQI